MRYKFFLAALALLLAACAAPPTPPPATLSPAPATLAPTLQVISSRPTALLTGPLSQVGACLRVADYLLVWPPDFEMSTAGQVVTVSDRLLHQEATVRLGDRVEIGGGEIPQDIALGLTMPAGCSGPYWVVGSLPHGVAPLATEAAAVAATATPSPAPSLTAAPSATASTAPTATRTPPPGVTEVAGDNLITFTSTVLGLTFSYRPNQLGASIRTFVSGERVYVYYTDMAPTDGQYVQVFRKAPGDTLAQAIQKQILAGYDPQACPVTLFSRPDELATPPSSDVFAMILPPALPTVSPNDDELATRAAQAQQCPAVYTVFGGDAHFMEDTRHPERFFFFKLGQYWIYSAGPGQYGYPWQDTLRVLALQT